MIRQGKNGPRGPLLKICGLRRAADVAHCVAQRVDFVGFNLYFGSKRFIEADAARHLWTGLSDRGTTSAVAVVVDIDPDELTRIVGAFPELTAVQFHGQESPERLTELRKRLGGRAVWKALGVATEGDVRETPRRYHGRCDLILVDQAKIPSGATVMGGSGQAFDWQWIKAYSAGIPLGVAGGITPVNAAEVCAYAQVSLVDVSTGVESAPGEKEPAAIAALARIMAL